VNAPADWINSFRFTIHCTVLVHAENRPIESEMPLVQRQSGKIEAGTVC